MLCEHVVCIFSPTAESYGVFAQIGSGLLWGGLLGIPLGFSFVRLHMGVGKASVSQMGCPGKWKHGPESAVPWCFNFDPYSHGTEVE